MKIKSILISVFVFMALLSSVSCAAAGNSERIDNTAASLLHEKIYLYEEGNVPYGDDCREFCFMTPYLAAYPTGGAVLVFPGGGYNHLSNSTSDVKGYGQGVDNNGNQKESSSIAAWYNERGISVFVVNYRTTAVEPNADYRHILSDAARAMRIVRGNAEKYYLSKDKIAVQGYSAGGHLAAMLLTQDEWVPDDENYVPDEYDKISAKPNAGVLCYAALSFQDELANKSTRKIFSGGDKALYDRFSAEKCVTANTPPCFLWCHEKDGTVNSGNTYAMAEALDKAGVYNECHVYDDNGTTAHGLGVAQEYEEARAWPDEATAFLKNMSF